MDQKGDYIIESANQTHNYLYLKRTLQLLVPISIISFLISYFSVFPSSSSSFHDLPFPTLIFPFLAQALDRKCMFLICNGILAFLAKNLEFNESAINYGGFMESNTDDASACQITQLPGIPVVDEENAVSIEYVDSDPLDAAVPQEKHEPPQHEEKGAEERETGVMMLESEDWGDEDEDEDEDEEVVEERGSSEADDTLAMEEVSDMRVSTEELNKKFEEFIRRMKEGIRIEARQQYMIPL